MAITNNQAQGLVLALFGASAGGHLTGLAGASSLSALAADLSTSAGLILGQDLSSNTAFRDLVLVTNLKLTGFALTEAQKWMDGEFGAGKSRADILTDAVTYLEGLTDTTNTFYAAAAAYRTTVADAVTWSQGAGATILKVATLREQQGHTEVVAGSSFTLSTSTTTPDLVTGTAGNDTISSSNTAFQAGDVIIDGSNTDSDTLNLTVTTTVAGNATVANIENINFANNAFATVAFDATTVTGAKTITLTNIKAGGATAATVNNVASDVAIVAGSGVTGTLTVDLAGGGNTVNAGTATTVTLTDANHKGVSITATKATTINLDGAGHTDTVTGAADDAATVSAAGAVALDTDTSDQVEYVTLSGNGAAVTYTIADETGAGAKGYTITGTQNVTVSIKADDLTGTTVTNSATGVTTIAVSAAAGAAVDFTKVDTSAKIRLDANVGQSTTVASGASLVAKVNQTGAVTAAAATKTTNTVTVEANDGVAQTSTISLGGNFTNIDTVNLVATDNLTANGLSYGSTATVNVSGAGDVVLGSLTAKAVNAADLTGTLTATASTNAKTITAGSGNDTISVGATESLTLNGGAGTDTLSIDGGSLDFVTANKTLTVSGFEVLQLDVGDSAAETYTLDSKIFNGKTWSVVGGTTADDTLAIKMSESTLDLSNVSIDASSIVNITTSPDSTRANSALTITGQAGADNITGGNAADTINTGNGANTVNAGTGDDTITGGTGIDNIDGQDGNDTIVAGAGADVLSGSNGQDNIRGGDGDDSIDGGADEDTLYGEAGADTIVGGTGADTIDGGSGADTIVGAGSWSTTGTSEVQTIAVTNAATGQVSFLGTAVAGSANGDANTATVTKIVADKTAIMAAWNAANPTKEILDIAGATNVLTITYKTTEGDVAVIATATSAGATFAASVETTKGTTIGTLSAGGVATADVLTGGSEKDLFVFGDSDTSLTLMPTITDLNLGTSTVAGQQDRIGIESNTDTVSIVTASTAQQAAINAETTLALGVVNALTNVAAAQGAATVLTYGENKYFLYNGDGNATFDAAADYIVKITGVVGTLDATDIVVVG